MSVGGSLFSPLPERSMKVRGLLARGFDVVRGEFGEDGIHIDALLAVYLTELYWWHGLFDVI
jgi:hypothetical protein